MAEKEVTGTSEEDSNSPGIIITLDSKDRKIPYSLLGVTFDSSPEEILGAVQPLILEEEGINIKADDEFIFTVKKATNSGNVYIFPKSPAGM